MSDIDIEALLAEADVRKTEERERQETSELGSASERRCEVCSGRGVVERRIEGIWAEVEWMAARLSEHMDERWAELRHELAWIARPFVHRWCRECDVSISPARRVCHSCERLGL